METMPQQSENHDNCMNIFTSFKIAATLCLFLPCLAGCVSKSTAGIQARAAYLAGQRDAIAQMNQAQQQPQPGTNATALQNLPSNITMIGPVENPVIPWTQDLTLAKAIVTAMYVSAVDPTVIIIRRSNEEIQIDPARLLAGADYPLLPGDIIQFRLPEQ